MNAHIRNISRTTLILGTLLTLGANVLGSGGWATGIATGTLIVWVGWIAETRILRQVLSMELATGRRIAMVTMHGLRLLALLGAVAAALYYGPRVGINPLGVAVGIATLYGAIVFEAVWKVMKEMKPGRIETWMHRLSGKNRKLMIVAAGAALLTMPQAAYASGGTFFGKLFGTHMEIGGQHLPIEHIITAAFVLILLTLFAVKAGGAVRKASQEDNYIPPEKFGLRNIGELLMEMLIGLCENIIGEGYRRYFPLLATVFIFILTCNLLGLVPGFLPPTEQINTNIPMAVLVFVYYWFHGIRVQGLWGWAKHFMGPPLYKGIPLLLFLFIPLELISHFARPLSLSLRLFGNITGDHAVVTNFFSMIPLVVPVPFMLLGVIVSVVQALVFTLLSMVYIRLAVEIHADHDHEEEHGYDHPQEESEIPPHAIS